MTGLNAMWLTLPVDILRLILAALFVIYALASVVALWRRWSQDVGTYSLVGYLIAAALATLGNLAAQSGWLSGLHPDVVLRGPYYASYGLALLFYIVTLDFLRLPGPTRTALGFGLIATLLLLLIDITLVVEPDVILLVGDLAFSRNQTLTFLWVAGWAIGLSASTWVVLHAFRRTQQPLHKNRLSYWAPALMAIVAGDGLLFIGEWPIGTVLHCIGSLIAAYAVTSFNLPDVRRAARTLMAYALALGTIFSLFLVGVGWIQFLAFGSRAFEQTLTFGLVAAVVLLFPQVLRVARWVADLLIRRQGYDSARLVRDYSAAISNIVDVKQLAQIALGILRDGLGIERGSLFLVDEVAVDGNSAFSLRSVGSLHGVVSTGLLGADSSVCAVLAGNRQPLTQYDIDLQPRFAELLHSEREWLSDLNVDVYVPIHAKGQWIGLLALGPKGSRDRYFAEDLTVLSTLADQSTVALENARLVDSLVALNRDLRQTNLELDDTRQRLERLDQAKSDFLAVVSHELRTPMGILLGYSQVLAADPQFLADPDHRTMVQGLQAGAERMQELIESMLDMVMVDNRALGLASRTVAVGALWESLRDKLGRSLRERALDFTLDGGLLALPNINADPDALRKVFEHLLINAIKFTPDGGQIRVTGATVSPRASFPNGAIEVTVSDTGIGIAPEDRDLIFDKFYQTGGSALHSSGKTKFKGGGPGLGLAIARGIVEAHGGRIWAESPGYDEHAFPGSTFHVMLPLPGRLRQSFINGLETTTERASEPAA